MQGKKKSLDELDIIKIKNCCSFERSCWENAEMEIGRKYPQTADLQRLASTLRPQLSQLRTRKMSTPVAGLRVLGGPVNARVPISPRGAGGAPTRGPRLKTQTTLSAGESVAASEGTAPTASAQAAWQFIGTGSGLATGPSSPTPRPRPKRNGDMITPRPVRTSCSPRHDSWTGRLKCLSACERINKLWYTLSFPNKRKQTTECRP